MQDFYRRAEFILSAAAVRHMPPDHGAEVAIAGRSNVGKSTFINVLTGIRKLARTSKTPGRTQLINFFALDDTRRLVDLPGYGFAKVPPQVKRQWQAMIESYLTSRRSLRGVVVLMDIRHPLTPLDQQLLHWCRATGLPVLAVLTKADKLSRGAARQTQTRVQRELAAEFPQAATVELFSALKPIDPGGIYARMDEWLGVS